MTQETRDPTLLRQAMRDVVWSSYPSPTFTPTEEQFVEATRGYILTSFPRETPVEETYPELVEADLAEQIGSQPESVQNQIKHVIYVAAINARSTTTAPLPHMS